MLNFESIREQAEKDMAEDSNQTEQVYVTYDRSQLSMIAAMPRNGLRHRLIGTMSPSQVHELNLMIAADPANKIVPTNDGQALSMLAVAVLTEPMPDKVERIVHDYMETGEVHLPVEHNFENRMHLVHANRRPRTTIK